MTDSSKTSWISAFLLALSLLLVKLVSVILKTARLRKIMPPGPRGLPLLGNMLDIGRMQWLRLTEWKEVYGPIFSLNLAGQPIIVLNDVETAVDLLPYDDLAENRSNIYGSRPRLVMAGEILTGSMFFPTEPLGDSWRRRRKAAHEGFNPRATTGYQAIQEQESAALALHILTDPDSWVHHVKRSTASTMLSVIYGKFSSTSHSSPGFKSASRQPGCSEHDEAARTSVDVDELVTRLHGFMQRILCACVPNAYLVEAFPTLASLPDWAAEWLREGRAWFSRDTRLFEMLLDNVRRRLAEDTAAADSSFAAKLLESEKSGLLSGLEAAWVAGTMFGAGSETTAAALSVFVLAMVLYPDAMKRAQAQIDAVVGRERLPAFSDRRHLTYVEAIVREVHRWRPVGPLGVAKRSVQDDWYKGYFDYRRHCPDERLVGFPAMNRDPRYFPDYDDFRPERYLDASGQLIEPMPHTHGQGHIAYGAGRRICMGKDMANQSMFIDFAVMLWAFDFAKAVDEDGSPITPSSTDCIDQSIVVRPVPFKCSIKPRSPEVASILRTATATSHDQRNDF
ncbi:hypothetical protein NM688_g1904 [Phlebia brevispora]|uniref:Uncharacterized protein n=1 Tax=Phlebia brevispora TaxID=194682 RepID=A0ACC1T9W1_9APHY|nr:hypothetical protein NM688_g1904 [Phlebia brevispora]